MKKGKLLKVMSMMSIGVLAMGMFTGCGNKAAETMTINSDKIIMATNAGFEPFEYYEGTEVVGFDIEIAQAIANKLGVELVIEDMAFDNTLLSLSSGKVDMVVAGLTVTEARAKQVDFSTSYFESQQSIIVKADDNSIQDADGLDRKSVV